MRMPHMLGRRHLHIKAACTHRRHRRSRTYEHIPPEKVGNDASILCQIRLVGQICWPACHAGIEIDANDKRIDKLIRVVKEKEFEGWAFDSAEASFELLARRMLDDVPDFSELAGFGLWMSAA